MAKPFLAYQEILVLAIIKEGPHSYTTLSCHQRDLREGGGEQFTWKGMLQCRAVVLTCWSETWHRGTEGIRLPGRRGT